MTHNASPAEPRDDARKTEEKTSEHGKKATLVAVVLCGLVVAGLVADGLWHSRKPADKAAQADATPPAPPPPAYDPFRDFEARQRAEAARMADQQPKDFSPSTSMPALASAVSGASPAAGSEQQLRDQDRLDDLKRALAAAHSTQGMLVPPPAHAVAVDVPAPAKAAPPSAGAGLGSVADGAGAQLASSLSPVDAANAVVGQTASMRRQAGQAQRPGEFFLPVGTVIDAILDMEISSDWEGRWRALVTRDVYDVSRDYILIPKGTRILGVAAKAHPVNESINERMALGVVWLVLPNGARIDLSRSGALDPSGVGALAGDVNRHFLAQIGGVAAYGVIGGLGAAAAAKAAGADNTVAVTATGMPVPTAAGMAGAEVAAGLVDIGRRVAARYLNIVPTITVKTGTPMVVFLDDELYLQPWALTDGMTLSSVLDTIGR